LYGNIVKALFGADCARLGGIPEAWELLLGALRRFREAS